MGNKNSKITNSELNKQIEIYLPKELSNIITNYCNLLPFKEIYKLHPVKQREIIRNNPECSEDFGCELIIYFSYMPFRDNYDKRFWGWYNGYVMCIHKKNDGYITFPHTQKKYNK